MSFVVRTYWRQIHEKAPYSLRRCLQSLRAQTNPYWEALIVRSDQTPMPGLDQLLAEFREARFRRIEVPGKPTTSISGYEVTDAVIALAKARAWLVVTNGDNAYAPTFVDALVANAHADVVAFDFYSRYVGFLDAVYVGSGCARYFWEPHGARAASVKTSS